MSISEHLILPAVKAEAAKYEPPMQDDTIGDEAGRAELEARRLRILDMYESGNIDRGERERRLAKVDAKLQKLDAYQVTWMVPKMSGSDWERYSPRDLNRMLRALFAGIELDKAGFQPIRFNWQVEPHTDYAIAQVEAERAALAAMESESGT